jgi:hypothetical protein
LVDVAALAGATLLLEGALLRLLAVAQFYHFAFLVVSLALLGFGASGTLLSLSPRLQRTPLDRLLPWTGAAFAAAVAASYAVVNWLPFDSYSIAWERRQILYFALYYLALTLPFVAGGLGIGAALAAGGPHSHRVYAANLLGSALGALLAPAALAWAGVPGAALAAAALGLFPAWRGRARWATGALLVGCVAALILLGRLNVQGRAPLALTISPYKGLAHALRYPGSARTFGGWNAIARVDVVEDAGTRLLPGLSYAYTGELPAQHGLALDAGALQPVTLVAPERLAAAEYLPEALAYALRPAAHALVMEPGAGLGVLQALHGGAANVTAVVANPLVRRAVAHTTPLDPFAEPRVQTVYETGRVFAQRDRTRYDLVVTPLTDPYQPVTSGAYSLAETYGLTVEALRALLDRLAPEGILVVTRWLQAPPSESVRLIGTLAAALEDSRSATVTPAYALVAYRGIQTITVLVQPDGWSDAELAAVRGWTSARRYDLVWAPDLAPGEVNRYNRLAEPVYAAAAAEALTGDRAAFYRAYPYAVAPATDDRPFFHHYFRWQQTPEVLATLGRTWQPFGGSGYFLLLALLALVLLLSAGLILAPLAALGRTAPRQAAPVCSLVYFGCLGLAFLFVEIPLIQRWILLVGHPTYAFTAVVLIVLLFSSVGSLLARRTWLRPQWALAAVTLLALATPFALGRLIQVSLGWPLLLRTAAAALALAPLAVCMGLPFPLGLVWLERSALAWVPWAWAVNGCASVVAGVLAAIVALSYGFTVVLLLGATAYAGAWLVYAGAEPASRPERDSPARARCV